MYSDVIIVDFFGVICSEISPTWLAKYLKHEDAIDMKATVVHAADIGELTQQEMFDKLGEVVKVTPKQVEDEWWSLVSIDDCVLQIISILRTNHRVALLTNSPAEFVRAILKKHNLVPLFDSIIVSSEERCAKPSLAIYQRTLERLSVRAQDTLMIDDNPANVQGASDAGMNGLVFESCTQLRKVLTERGYLSGS